MSPERHESLHHGLSSDCAAGLDRWFRTKRSRVSPNTLAAIVCDLVHFAEYCRRQKTNWYPTDKLVLRNFVQNYGHQRSHGAIKRIVFYVRSVNEIIGVGLADLLLDEVMDGLAKEAKRSARTPVRHDALCEISDSLSNDFLGLYTRALLWTIYDSQFRIRSLLQVKLESVKVMRPSGIAWLPIPEKPVRWEDGGGFLPPSTAGHLRDWFAVAGIIEGYLFPLLRQGRATNKSGSPKQALLTVDRILRKAGYTRKVTFRAIRNGSVADMEEANVGIPRILRRSGFSSYRSVSTMLKRANRLDSGSLELAKCQNRWGIPHGY